MESNHKLKGIGIKSCKCYYLSDIIKIEDFNFDIILLDKKSYKIILVFDIPRKTLIGVTPLHIRFDKVDGFTEMV